MLPVFPAGLFGFLLHTRSFDPRATPVWGSKLLLTATRTRAISTRASKKPLPHASGDFSRVPRPQGANRGR